VRDVGVDTLRGIGRAIAGFLRTGEAASGFLFLFLGAGPFAGSLHGGWS
jgi:hypothetical protein